MSTCLSGVLFVAWNKYPTRHSLRILFLFSSHKRRSEKAYNATLDPPPRLHYRKQKRELLSLLLEVHIRRLFRILYRCLTS